MSRQEEVERETSLKVMRLEREVESLKARLADAQETNVTLETESREKTKRLQAFRRFCEGAAVADHMGDVRDSAAVWLAGMPEAELFEEKDEDPGECGHEED